MYLIIGLHSTATTLSDEKTIYDQQAWRNVFIRRKLQDFEPFEMLEKFVLLHIHQSYAGGDILQEPIHKHLTYFLARTATRPACI